MVTFADGAVVTKVAFPSDFSAVRLTGMPSSTTPAAVSGILQSLGFTVSSECIRFSSIAENAQGIATVRVQDPLFAKRLLPAIKDHDTLQAVPISATLPQSTSYRRVDSKKVHCSWHKPTKAVWLNFAHGDCTTKISTDFQDGHYKIMGQKVKAEKPTYSRDFRNPRAWTIKLSDVPGSAKKEDVLRNVPVARRPRHVELSPPTYATDLAKENTLLESLLSEYGVLENWKGATDGVGKRYKAEARFIDDADARQAVKACHDRPLPFHPNGKLTVQLVHSARLKVTERLYRVIEHEIACIRPLWDSQHLRYTAYPPVHGFRILKIEAETSKDVANAKSTLERIIDGEVLIDSGKPVWAASFAANGRIRERIREIECELDIIIVRDKRRSQLRLIGPHAGCGKARPFLIELGKKDSSSIYVIELDAQRLDRALKGGYRALAATFGEDNVTLDIASSPCRISLSGSEADFRAAQDLLATRGKTQELGPDSNSTGDCAICWTEAEHPVHTHCKHVYCGDCYENSCFAAISDINSDGNIRCQGNAGECREQLGLAELQAHLPSAVFEDILEASFSAYVADPLHNLRYCPSPDCGQVYRAAKPSTDGMNQGKRGRDLLFTCPLCFTVVCTSCHILHDGLTCAEHLFRTSGEYQILQDTKKKLGIKDCPKCGAMIEKTFGCNHMTCSACNAHICWVCMELFPAGGLVYAHMNKAHGGIGVEYYPGLG